MKLFMALFLNCLLYMINAVSYADASDYPDRSIEMVIPFESGTAIDVLGRILSGLAEKELGVKIVLNNKPGGAGATGYTYVKNSRPDGYTLSLVNSTIASHKVFGNLPFDYDDVEVILIFESSPSVLCVPSNSKYKSFGDVIADAKERPGQIVYATASGNLLNGTRDFCYHAGIQFKILPFGGGGQQPVIQASGGHVDISFTNILDTKAPIEAGLLRPLAVYGKKRIDFLPDIPTFEELGYPVRCPVIRGLIAPPGVPKEKLEIINAAFRKAVSDPKYIDFVRNSAGTPMDASFTDAIDILDEQRNAFILVASQEKGTS